MIRHGLTPGNMAGRYLGRTDEDIIERALLGGLAGRFPPADAVYSSPLRRCVSTARMIYPGRAPVIVRELAECCFGDFEGKTADELSDNAFFKEWLETGTLEAFPNGERMADFLERCWRAFVCIVREAADKGFEHISIVSHGGVIGAVTHRLLRGENGIYLRVVANLDGVAFAYDPESRVLTGFRLLSAGA